MDIRTLQTLLVTLSKITVAGKDNMSMLLGCINLVETALREAAETAPKEDEKE